MWMNSIEIDEALWNIRAQGPQRLRDAAEFLAAFRDLINEISDGWPYWGYGTKCSQDLQDLIEAGKWPSRSQEASAEQLSKAKRKVVTFLRRCKQTKDKPEVLRFLEAWR